MQINVTNVQKKVLDFFESPDDLSEERTMQLEEGIFKELGLTKEEWACVKLRGTYFEVEVRGSNNHVIVSVANAQKLNDAFVILRTFKDYQDIIAFSWDVQESELDLVCSLFRAIDEGL